jgi:Holliday junction resolvase
MSETLKQREILKALEVLGCYARRVKQANKAGTHDILACCNGKFLSVEVKSARGTSSVLQRRNALQVEAAGGRAIVAKTVKEVVQIVKEMQNAKER